MGWHRSLRRGYLWTDEWVRRDCRGRLSGAFVSPAGIARAQAVARDAIRSGFAAAGVRSDGGGGCAAFLRPSRARLSGGRNRAGRVGLSAAPQMTGNGIPKPAVGFSQWSRHVGENRNLPFLTAVQSVLRLILCKRRQNAPGSPGAFCLQLTRCALATQVPPAFAFWFGWVVLHVGLIRPRC